MILKIKKLLRPFYIKIITYIKFKKRGFFLKNKKFSIIANNCLGGFIYQYYGLEYRTPTIGLFINTNDYLKFLENINYYLSQPLIFIETKLNFPVARIDDIVIHFIHYKTKEEAIEKWNRRIKRINWDSLLVINSQPDQYTYEQLLKFNNLPFKHKIWFTQNQYPLESTIYIERLVETNYVISLKAIMKHVNLAKILNNLNQ